MADAKDSKDYKVYHLEDLLFVKCLVQFEEFPQYITGFKDIRNSFDSRFASSSNFSSLNLDCVRQREDLSLIDIEHHSSIRPDLMRRNYEYAVNLYNVTGYTVHPFIFYTGDLPVNKIIRMNDFNTFQPHWFILKEKDGMKSLNNIKYKTFNKIDWNVFDAIDFAWIPKFDIDMLIEDCIVELAEIYKIMPADNKFLQFCRESLKLWTGKYIKDKERLDKVKECLNMSLEEIPFEEQLRGVILEGEIERAELKVKNEIIIKLLKTMSPQEISERLELPLDSILSIQNSCSK